MRRRPSVLFVTREFPLISERFVLDQAAALVDGGCRVTVYATRGLGEPSLAGEVAAAGLAGRVHTPLAGRGRVGLAAAAGLAALRRPAAAGRGWRAAGPLRLRAAPHFLLLDRWLRRRRPFDLLHGQFGPLGLLAVLARRAGSHRGRVVVSFRGWDASEVPRRYGPEVYRELFAGADLCLPNCEHFRRRLLELGCPSGKVRVQRSGIRLESFPLRSYRDPDRARPRLLTVGRLVEKKGIAVALEAVANLAGRWPGLRYRVAGGGPLAGRLARRAGELGIEGQVEWLGPRRRREVAELMRESDFLLAPSVASRRGDEDAPLNVLKEAMAVGLPVVATRHGGIPELVRDGETGFLVPESDPTALAAAVAAALEQPGRLPKVVAAARGEIEGGWDAADLGHRLRGLYDEILEE